MTGGAPVRSMTGAGRARGSTPLGDLVVELRAVNGRGLAVKHRLPAELAAFERESERLVRSRLERGTVTVSMRLERSAAALDDQLDEGAFVAVAERLAELAAQNGLARVTVTDVLSVPGVLRSTADAADEAVWSEVEPLSRTALDALVREREIEGSATAAAMTEALDDVRRLRDRVAARAPSLADDYRDRLLARVEEFVRTRGLQLEASDVVREVAMFADRSAIDEELQRLATHLGRARELLDRGGPVGRALEFLLQEMLREINTVGSKSPDVEIAHTVVEMKGAVDKLKEQAANLE